MPASDNVYLNRAADPASYKWRAIDVNADQSLYIPTTCLVDATGAAYTAAKSTTQTDGTQISQIGASAASTGAWTVTRYGAAVGATAIASTLLVKAGAGRVRRVHVSQKSGVTMWVGITNLVTLLGNGVIPDYDASVGTGIGSRALDFGENGLYCSAGINLSLSKTQQITDNTTTVTSTTVIVEWM